MPTTPGTPVDPRLAPKYVRKDLGALAAETGVEPGVSQSEPGTWHITADNGRVQLVSTYSREHASPGGVHNWVCATVTIDGVSRPVDRLFAVGDAFSCPDDVLAGRPPRPVAVASWTAPRPVRDALKAFRPAFASDDASWGPTLIVGRIGSRWVVAADTDRLSLRVHFGLTPRGQWTLPLHRGIELIVDGVDRTAEVASDMNRAASLMSSAMAPADPGAPRGAAVTPTSVQVRTTVVRRT